MIALDVRSEIYRPAARAAVRRRSSGCCEDCFARLPLELHHRTYREIETPETLRALCRECHHARHVDNNGDFWADPEEMADHWWYYEKEMGQ